MICTGLWSVGGDVNGLDLDWGDIGWWEQVVDNFCVGQRRDGFICILVLFTM